MKSIKKIYLLIQIKLNEVILDNIQLLKIQRFFLPRVYKGGIDKSAEKYDEDKSFFEDSTKRLVYIN